MKLAVIGSRNCEGLTIERVIENIPKNCTMIISGGAYGVDELAKKAAIALGIPIKEYFPDYTTFGKKAPLIRNTSIVNDSDMVLAFWDYQSKGTRNTLLKSLNQKKEIKIIII